MFSVAPVQQRFSHDHHFVSQKEIGPPASFNQLPQPEGDWTENHQKKQTKYNAVLAASVLFFAATFGFVSIHTNSIQPNRVTSQSLTLFSISRSLVQMKQSGIIYFNASAPDTYE